MMRNLATFLIFLVPTIALADNHSNDGLMLPKRQADTVMEVTSVSLGEEISSIDAIGDMGVYGKVYVTFNLEANGKVHGRGVGATTDGTIQGIFSGYWDRDDGLITMRHVVQLSDGTMNLDVVTFDPLKKELIVRAHTLK
ncbi:MAG: hypothetical protein VW684_07515 [Betaproteobacteria bacterium]